MWNLNLIMRTHPIKTGLQSSQVKITKVKEKVRLCQLKEAKRNMAAQWKRDPR